MGCSSRACDVRSERLKPCCQAYSLENIGSGLHERDFALGFARVLNALYQLISQGKIYFLE